jgi:outer membrane protein insertion porin family
MFLSVVSADVVLYENQKVQSIVIESGDGNQAPRRVEESIRNRLRTREGFPFSQITFDDDLKSLAQDFDWVEPKVEFVNNGLELTLIVWEKPIIRSISFKGNKCIKDSTLLGELDICTAVQFDRNAFMKAFRKLKTYYVKLGYFEVDVSYNINRDPSSNEVDLEICIREGRSGRIKQIFFSGFEGCEEEDILELMVTKEWNIVTGVFGNGGFYNEDMIAYDQYQVVNYLQNRGYADARVKLEVVPASRPNWINVCISTDRGERYRFGKVSFQGNCIYPDDVIEKLIQPEDGAIFSPEAVRDSIKNLQDAYGLKGHIEAVIDDDLNLHADEPVYDVHFTIEEGAPFRVGLIKIFGNTYTENRVILHETLLRPGELFNMLKLRYTEERLRNIGYFKRVNVYGVRVSQESCLGENYRDLHIEVEEGPTGNLGAFVGLSSSNDLFGGFNITEKNFRIEGLLPWSFKKYGWSGFKGAGEYAHFTATFGQKNNNYVLSWTKPYFMDSLWAVGIDLDRNANGALSKKYDVVSYGGSVFAKRPINAFVIAGLHYRLKNSVLHGRDKLDKKDPEFDQLKGTQGLVSAAGLSLSYNTTNHPLRPTDGVNSKVEAEVSGLGGERHFGSLAYLNSIYHPFGSKGYIRLKADFKFIQPFDKSEQPHIGNWSTIPQDDRFFLGGDYLVRGYRPFALGPKFKDRKDDAPKGGISLGFLSIEYDWQLFSRAELFLFSDAGSVSDHAWKLSQLYCSVGYGVKLYLLEGTPPLVLGMGYPLNAKNNGDVKRFFISLGAKF